MSSSATPTLPSGALLFLILQEESQKEEPLHFSWDTAVNYDCGRVWHPDTVALGMCPSVPPWEAEGAERLLSAPGSLPWAPLPAHFFRKGQLPMLPTGGIHSASKKRVQKTFQT